MELVSVVVLAWALEVRDSRFRKACGSKHPGREVIPVGMNLLWALVDHLVGLFLLHLCSSWLCLSACVCGAGLARPVFIVFSGLPYPEHLFTSWLLEFQLHILAGWGNSSQPRVPWAPQGL